MFTSFTHSLSNSSVVALSQGWIFLAPRSICNCVEAFLVVTMTPRYYWHLGPGVRVLNFLQCTRVSHTANNCLTQSANSPLVEKQCKYKPSEGKDCILFFTVPPTPAEPYP